MSRGFRTGIKVPPYPDFHDWTKTEPYDLKNKELEDSDISQWTPLYIPSQSSSADDEDSEENQDQFKLHDVDRFLAFVSLVMLGVAIIGWWAVGKSLTVPLWDVMVVFDSGLGSSPAPASSAVNALRQKLVEWCPDNTMKDLAMVPMYGMSAIPVTTIKHTAIDLWLLIFVMIGVTLGFQFYRSHDGYNPKGPSVGRWFEYALTSPLMLIVVALSFHIREQSTLYCLGALQILLVAVGFSIEREIQLFFNKEESKEKSIVKQRGFQLLYAASLLAHACIWYTIIARWLRESQAVDDCTFENVRKFSNETKHEQQYKQMNGIIQALVFSQCALFSLYAFMPYVTCTLLSKCERDMVSLEEAWRKSARNYSCLSVFCKSVLIIIFIVYASKVPEIYSHKLDVEVDPRCHVECAPTPAPTPAPPPPAPPPPWGGITMR